MPSIEIPDKLRCLYTAELNRRNGSYVIEVPNQELQQGDLQQEETYRIAIFPAPGSEATGQEPDREPEAPKPPVEEGDVRQVEIEDIGRKGDGIAKVERGYVVIVPDTEVGDKVTIEITNVMENFAIGEVTSGISEAGRGRGGPSER